MDLPRVYAMNHNHTKWACQYYRFDVPLDCFEKFNLAITWNDKLEQGIQNSIKGMLHADFDLFWGMGGVFAEQVQDIKNMKPCYNDDGLQMPPTLIYDLDDNRDYIHPHNTVFCTEGVRAYPSTKLLEPGQRLLTRDEETGEVKTLWEDLVTEYGGKTFDIARNLQNMRSMHRIFRMVHGMTVTGPHLKKYLQDVIGVKNVHVFPNTIVPEHYYSYPILPHTGVRILWQGGASHTIDWYPLRHALKEVAKIGRAHV